MQRLGIDLGKPDGIFNVKQSSAVLESTRAAIRRGNLMSAFKMFIALPDPSTEPDWPRNAMGKPIRNFLTDGFPRASYVLPPKEGSTITSALVSYAWGVDALKYEQMGGLTERQQTIAASYIYGTDAGTPNTSVFGKYILTGTEPASVVWNAEAGFGGGFKLDKPEDNYFTNSLFYHFQQAHSRANPGAAGSRVFFAGDSVGHLGGWVEGAGMSAINAIVAVCSEIAFATGEIALRDQSVSFLLDPTSNLFHKYVFVQGQQVQYTGLLEMHRVGSEDGIASAPPSDWSLVGPLQPPAGNYLLSTAVSSDGNIVAMVRNDGTVWIQERDEFGAWSAAVMIDGLNSIEKISIDSYERFNGPSQLVQLMAVAQNEIILHGIRTNGLWSSFQQPYPTARASECAIVLDGVNLQFVLKDSNADLRHGIRYPDNWTALGYPPGLNGTSNLKVASIAIGCTSLAVDLTTVAVIDFEGVVYVGTRYGAQGGNWSLWQRLEAPEGPASRVALVVQDDSNHAQLIATYGSAGPSGPNEVFSSARYAVVGPSVGTWTPLRKVPYPIGGKGRGVGTIAISRLPRVSGTVAPPFSTMILADVYPSWSKTV